MNRREFTRLALAGLGMQAIPAMGEQRAPALPRVKRGIDSIGGQGDDFVGRR
jgi:hypothetical protein